MTSKKMLFLLTALAGAAAYLWLAPGDAPRQEAPPAPAAAPSPPPSSPAAAAPAVAAAAPAAADPVRLAEERRVAAMRAEYARLESARDEVRLRLGRIKARLWKLRLPAAQARAMETQLRQGHALLHNPPMLGAFYDADDIRREITRVTAVGAELEQLEAAVEEQLDARKEQP